MRYIRDIIQDRKNETVETPPVSHRTGDQPKPLLLEDPVFPIGSDAEASPGSEEAIQGAEQDDNDTKMSVVETNNISERNAFAPRNARSVRNAGIAPEVDMTSEADPFDKLRNSTEPAPDKTASVSPLRVSRNPAIPNDRDTNHPLSSKPKTAPEAEEAEELTPLVDALDPDKVQMPAPAMGRGSKVSGRVKTRLLGFSAEAFNVDDPFKNAEPASNDFPVGWLVVVSEKGRGKSFALRDGVSSVGRGSDQAVCLDIGDNSISRENHISIAFDAEQKKFFVGHGGKTNLVRLNNAPLLSTEELNSKDSIRLGETTLRFIAFCGEDFGWDTTKGQSS